MKSVTARLTEGDLRCSYPHVLAAKIDTYLDAALSKKRFFFLVFFVSCNEIKPRVLADLVNQVRRLAVTATRRLPNTIMHTHLDSWMVFLLRRHISPVGSDSGCTSFHYLKTSRWENVGSRHHLFHKCHANVLFERFEVCYFSQPVHWIALDVVSKYTAAMINAGITLEPPGALRRK